MLCLIVNGSVLERRMTAVLTLVASSLIPGAKRGKVGLNIISSIALHHPLGR